MRTSLATHAKGFKVKDFRTHLATTTARQLMLDMPSPTTPAEFAKARNSIGDQVSKMLGNTHPQDGARLVHRPDRVHGVGGRRQCLTRSSCSPQRNATVSCRRTSRRTATPPLTARHWTRRPPLRGRPRRQGQRAMAYRSPQHKHGGGKFKSERQRRYIWAVVPRAAKRWDHNRGTSKSMWAKRRPARPSIKRAPSSRGRQHKR